MTTWGLVPRPPWGGQQNSSGGNPQPTFMYSSTTPTSSTQASNQGSPISSLPTLPGGLGSGNLFDPTPIYQATYSGNGSTYQQETNFLNGVVGYADQFTFELGPVVREGFGLNVIPQMRHTKRDRLLALGLTLSLMRLASQVPGSVYLRVSITSERISLAIGIKSVVILERCSVEAPSTSNLHPTFRPGPLRGNQSPLNPLPRPLQPQSDENQPNWFANRVSHLRHNQSRHTKRQLRTVPDQILNAFVAK